MRGACAVLRCRVCRGEMGAQDVRSRLGGTSWRNLGCMNSARNSSANRIVTRKPEMLPSTT